MKIQVEGDLWQQIRAHAQSGYPAEICGFLLGSLDLKAGEIHLEAGRPATNGRVDAAHHRYLIEPVEYQTVEREATNAGTQIVGIYHSHPDTSAEPSTFDLTHAWPNQVYIIVSVRQGAVSDVKAWMLTDNRQSFDNVQISDRNASRSTPRLEGATCQNS